MHGLERNNEKRKVFWAPERAVDDVRKEKRKEGKEKKRNV